MAYAAHEVPAARPRYLPEKTLRFAAPCCKQLGSPTPSRIQARLGFSDGYSIPQQTGPGPGKR